MPTGYTAEVATGEIDDLTRFAYRCARAMGALVTMRDDPWDAPIPDQFEPDTSYHDTAILKAQATIAQMEMWDDVQIERAYAQAKADHEARFEADLAKCRETSARYEAMLSQVKNHPWPDELHSFRDFMVEQLTTSIDYDCRPPLPNPLPSTAAAWKAAQIARANSDLTYHKKARLDEIARIDARNIWLKLLKETLK